MKNTLVMNDESLVAKAVDSLVRHLGVVDAQRFVSLPVSRRMDSVRRHRLWQSALREKEFLDAVFKEESRGNS